jgi:hypothetical protein
VRSCGTATTSRVTRQAPTTSQSPGCKPPSHALACMKKCNAVALHEHSACVHREKALHTFNFTRVPHASPLVQRTVHKQGFATACEPLAHELVDFVNQRETLQFNALSEDAAVLVRTHTKASPRVPPAASHCEYGSHNPSRYISCSYRTGREST